MHKKSKKILLLSILFFLFSIAFVIGLIVFNIHYAEATLQNTTEFSATITNINSEHFFMIETNQFNSRLMVSDQTVVNRTALNNLQRGDIIYFRVRNRHVDNLNTRFEAVSVEIITLRVNYTDIVTIDMYNSYAQWQRQWITLTQTFGIVVFLSLGIVFVILHVKRLRRY